MKLLAAIRENALSIAFGLLLVVTLAGQALVGLAQYNHSARTDEVAQIDLWRYVTSSSFLVDVAENWQSEYLQFTLYILLTVWLVQRCSSESKQASQVGLGTPSDELMGPYAKPESPAAAKAGGWMTGLYSVSLTLVMATIFVFSWAAQAITGRVSTNEERLRDQLDPLTLGQYLTDPDFWSRTLQNWQSELLAVGSMAVFTVYLRQRGSPESKSVGSPHEQTG